MTRVTAFAILLACAAMAGSACQGNNPEYGVRVAVVPDTGGNLDRGRQVIEQYNCGSCHTIPGVPGASGLVAPPLLWFSRWTYIAGELPNTPENLVRWVRNPPSVEPNTAMPIVGLDEQQAKDVAAYLYTLR